MSTVETIEQQIKHLTPDELAEFRAWFAEFDGDAQSQPTISGKSRDEVDALIEEGYQSGPTTPMTQQDWRGLHDRIDQS